MSTDTALGPFTLVYSVPVDFAFQDTRPGNAGGSRLVVGDAANGDSILRASLGNNLGLCANGDLHLVDPGPLSAERAGTLALEAASPWTDAEPCDRRDQRYHQRHHRRKRTLSVGRPLPNRRRA